MPVCIESDLSLLLYAIDIDQNVDRAGIELKRMKPASSNVCLDSQNSRTKTSSEYIKQRHIRRGHLIAATKETVTRGSLLMKNEGEGEFHRDEGTGSGTGAKPGTGRYIYDSEEDVYKLRCSNKITLP